MTYEATLRRIIGRAELLLANMPDYHAARAMLAPSPLRAARTDAGRTSQGGHSDPTLGTVIATLGEKDTDDFADAVNAAAGTLDFAFAEQRKIIASVAHRPRTDIETVRYERRMRDGLCLCTNPDCQEQATYRFDSGTRWAGYSQTCRDRERQAEYRARVAQPVAQVCYVPARVESRALVEPELPAHNVYCSTCRTDYQLPVGVNPQTWHLEHKATCDQPPQTQP